MVTVRRAVAADTAQVIDLINELERTFSFAITDKDSNLCKFQQFIAEGKYTVFVAETTAREFVGVITLAGCIAFYAEGEMGMIHEFYVQEAYRSQGVAKQLMDAAKLFARQKGWPTLELSTPHHSKNESAKRFYLKEGFQDFGIHFYYDPE